MMLSVSKAADTARDTALTTRRDTFIIFPPHKILANDSCIFYHVNQNL